MDYVDAEVRLLLDAAIAPSSSRTYDTGVKSYLQFCAATSTQPFPATEDDLLRFIASVRRRLSYKTIKVYLAGVQYKSALMGLQLRLHTFSRLHYALRGIRRLQGSEFPDHHGVGPSFSAPVFCQKELSSTRGLHDNSSCACCIFRPVAIIGVYLPRDKALRSGVYTVFSGCSIRGTLPICPNSDIKVEN